MEQRPFVVLEKKLAELELQLGELFLTDDGDTGTRTTMTYRQQMAVDEIQGKIEFLKTLMIAEKDCHANDMPAHLSHVEKRLAALDDAFHNWVDFGIKPDDDLGELAVCFCSDSCFGEAEAGKEEEEEEEEYSVPEPDYFVPTVSRGVELLGLERSRGDEDGKLEQKQCRRLYSRLCGFMAGAVVVAVSVAVIGIGTNFGREEKNFYLVPT